MTMRDALEELQRVARDASISDEERRKQIDALRLRAKGELPGEKFGSRIFCG